MDTAKILVYGAVDPLPTIKEKLKVLNRQLRYEDGDGFKHRILKWIMAFKVKWLRRMVRKGAYQAAQAAMERHLLARTDGCVQSGSPDGNDWITDCELQTRTYWAVHEIMVLMKIIE